MPIIIADCQLTRELSNCFHTGCRCAFEAFQRFVFSFRARFNSVGKYRDIILIAKKEHIKTPLLAAGSSRTNCCGLEKPLSELYPTAALPTFCESTPGSKPVLYSRLTSSAFSCFTAAVSSVCFFSKFYFREDFALLLGAHRLVYRRYQGLQGLFSIPV